MEPRFRHKIGLGPQAESHNDQAYLVHRRWKKYASQRTSEINFGESAYATRIIEGVLSDHCDGYVWIGIDQQPSRKKRAELQGRGFILDERRLGNRARTNAN